MRRRLQSFSLAACKDKTTLKTTFYYDNVHGSSWSNNEQNEDQLLSFINDDKTQKL